MPPIPMETLVASGVTMVVNIVVAVIVAVITRRTNRAIEHGERERDNTRSENEALRAGVKSLLRSELVRAHREYAQQDGYLTLEEREYVQHTYDAYQGLGGNDVGHRLYAEIMELPTHDVRRE